ncbi:vancomycin high temperature exclusion protein [Lacinutrix sp. Hel_I_90]|uniref:SanA/YdcF family protein n=1 Tax=Lacinutrix sp. Hel_I_90 TaxID=1249999 RepID=UPI0005C870C9|nr:ElyC/SanA/YdcF family protein [Lacinutrix sp. Hel_I_90]
MKYLKQIFRISLRPALLVLIIILTSHLLIKEASKGRTYDSVNDIPKHKVGLVLGTIKTLSNGSINLYYKYRVDATVALFKANKIEFILVSGDNGNTLYDEPSTFKEDLIKKGIPENKIFLDYAGFRTLDSIVRAKEIFGLTHLIIISQKFHNERAIYLARQHSIEAIGFNAKELRGRYSLKTNLREQLAKTKAVFDVYFNIKPKFLGEKIKIE